MSALGVQIRSLLLIASWRALLGQGVGSPGTQVSSLGASTLPAPGYVNSMVVLPDGSLAAACGNSMGLPSSNVSVWNASSARQNGAGPSATLTSSQGPYTQIRCLLSLPNGTLVTGGQTNNNKGMMELWPTPLLGGTPTYLYVDQPVTAMLLLPNGTLLVAGGSTTTSFVAFYDPPFSSLPQFIRSWTSASVQAVVQLTDGAVALAMNTAEAFSTSASLSSIYWWPSAGSLRSATDRVGLNLFAPWQFSTTLGSVARVQTLLPLPNGGLAALVTSRQSVSNTAAIFVWSNTQALQSASPFTVTQSQCTGCTFFSISQLASGAVVVGVGSEQYSRGAYTNLAFVYSWPNAQALASNQAPTVLSINSQSDNTRLAVTSVAPLPGGLLAAGTYNYGPPAYAGSVIVFDPLATTTSTTGTSTTQTTNTETATTTIALASTTAGTQAFLIQGTFVISVTNMALYSSLDPTTTVVRALAAVTGLNQAAISVIFNSRRMAARLLQAGTLGVSYSIAAPDPSVAAKLTASSVEGSLNTSFQAAGLPPITITSFSTPQAVAGTFPPTTALVSPGGTSTSTQLVSTTKGAGLAALANSAKTPTLLWPWGLLLMRWCCWTAHGLP